VTILIEGRMRLNFPAVEKSIELEKLGDFVMYDTLDSDHSSLPLRDSLLLVIRTQ